MTDALLALIYRNPMRAADVAARMGVCLRTVYRHVDRAREQGYVIPADRGRSGGIVFYGQQNPKWKELVE